MTNTTYIPPRKTAVIAYIKNGVIKEIIMLPADKTMNQGREKMRQGEVATFIYESPESAFELYKSIAI